MTPETNNTSELTRVLWVRVGSCWPLHSGGSIYSYHLLRELMNHCHVHVLESYNDVPPPRSAPASPPYAHEVEQVFPRSKPVSSLADSLGGVWPIIGNLVASREPYALTVFHNPELSKRIQELATTGRFNLIIADGLFVAPSFEGWEKECRVPTILLQHNVEAFIWRRMVKLQRNPFTRLFFDVMARRLQRREPELCGLFDGITTISDQDAAYHREAYGLTNILGSVPPGATTGQRDIPPAVLLQEASPCIAFLGAMNWPPNIDAAFWFIESILPLIRQAMPEVRFRIIGRDPPKALHRLAASKSGVEITGRVDDVLPPLRECALLVVPLRAGSGVRHKIIESMAAGVPVVSTTYGSEGLDVRDGDEILLADGEQALSSAILRLLGDAALRERIAESARMLVAEKFSWQRSVTKLLKLVSALVK